MNNAKTNINIEKTQKEKYRTTKVKIPEKLKIACFDIKVKKVSERESAITQRYGHFSSLDLSMSIQDGLDPIKTIDTLLHEIGHVIYWAYGLEDSDKEERLISTMSTAWTQVYRDNPQLLKFIQYMLGAK